MTKSQIKAELRRSACEDDYPYGSVDILAWVKAVSFCDETPSLYDLKRDDCRTFFLLVAEAL